MNVFGYSLLRNNFICIEIFITDVWPIYEVKQSSLFLFYYLQYSSIINIRVGICVFNGCRVGARSLCIAISRIACVLDGRFFTLFYWHLLVYIFFHPINLWPFLVKDSFHFCVCVYVVLLISWVCSFSNAQSWTHWDICLSIAYGHLFVSQNYGNWETNDIENGCRNEKHKKEKREKQQSGTLKRVHLAFLFRQFLLHFSHCDLDLLLTEANQILLFSFSYLHQTGF